MARKNRTPRLPRDVILDWAMPVRRSPKLTADLRACRAAYLQEQTGQLIPRDLTNQYIWATMPTWLKRRYKNLWDTVPPLTRLNLDVALSKAVLCGAWYPVAPDQLTSHLRGWGDGKSVKVSIFSDSRRLQPPWRPNMRAEPREEGSTSSYRPPLPGPSPLSSIDWSELKDLTEENVPLHVALVLHLFDYATLAEAESALRNVWSQRIEPLQDNAINPNARIALPPGLQIGSPGKHDDLVSKMDKDVTLYRLWLRWCRYNKDNKQRFAFAVTQDNAQGYNDSAYPWNDGEQAFLKLFERSRQLIVCAKRQKRVPKNGPTLPWRLQWLNGKRLDYVERRLNQAIDMFDPAPGSPTIEEWIQQTHKHALDNR